MTESLQEHVHRFNAGITLRYRSRTKHLQIPLSVDALETNPWHITVCFVGFCVFLLLLLFKGIDLFLSSGTDVAAGLTTLTLQHGNIMQVIIRPMYLHSESTSPLSQECIQLKEHLCSLEPQLKPIVLWLQIIQIQRIQGPTVSLEIQPALYQAPVWTSTWVGML